MADWIDTLGDGIFRIAESFMDTDRPMRLLGLAFVAITAFGVVGTLVSVALGANLAPVGYYVLIPSLLATTTIAVYCFLTDRAH